MIFVVVVVGGLVEKRVPAVDDDEGDVVLKKLEEEGICFFSQEFCRQFF